MNSQYQSKWESRSSIRSSPRKPINFEHVGYFFPVDRQLLFLLPETLDLSEQTKKEILVLTFCKYLNDMIHLEIRTVNAACNNILYKEMIISYSDQVKLNAYTVIIDEYYHAYIAHNMISQLKEAFPGLPQLHYELPDSSNAIDTIKNRLDKKYHDIFEIIVACIFETTLVRELVGYFNSKEIHPAIMHYVNDHMNDESRHYGFFYDVLCQTWSNLPEDYQRNLGMHLADFITLYLNINSEKSYNLQLLTWILNDSEKAQTAIENLYTEFYISPEIPIVNNVLNVLKKSGILDCEYAKHSFQQHNLYI